MKRLSWFSVLGVFVLAGTPSLLMAQSATPDRVEGGMAMYPNFEGELTIGGMLRGRHMVSNDWFALGGVTALVGDTDLIALYGGAAYLHPLDAQTDLWGGPTLEYQDLTFEHCSFSAQQNQNTCSNRSVDDLGVGLRGGLRHRFHRQLEGEAGARVVTGDLDYIGFSATGRYLWQNNLRILAEIDFYDDNFGILGGLSLDF